MSRPTDPASLLLEPQHLPAGWELTAASSPRFYVWGLVWFLRTVRRADVLFLTEYAERAIKEIDDLGIWAEFLGKWDRLSYNQFRNVRSKRPVMFDKAAMILYTCEVALRDLAKETLSPEAAAAQLYSNMWIIPAVYNIDRFPSALDQLKRDHASGVEVVLQDANQADDRLLDDMANGYCVTRDTALAIHGSFRARFKAIPIGEVRAEPGRQRLGRKGASLREIIELDRPTGAAQARSAAVRQRLATTTD